MNNRISIALAVLIVGTIGGIGCVDDTLGLDGGPQLDGGVEVDAGPVTVEYCQGVYHGLEGQNLTSISVPCARGSVCGTGQIYQICREGEDEARPWIANLQQPQATQRAVAELPGYPWCDQTEPTSQGDRCLFQPGCAEPVGLWCRALPCTASDGIIPITACGEEPGCQLTYCGCDGETYEGLPFFPYAHPGPCR